MNLFPARKPPFAASDAAGTAATEGSEERALVLAPQPGPGAVDSYLAARPGPAEWARQRRAAREARHVEAVGNRAAARIEHLGPAWHVVQWPRTEVAHAGRTSDRPQKEQAGFLAIGPGGIFAVSVADHGRTRVLIAGDVVQINGRRPPWVAEARRDARQASRVLTRAVGHAVPVVPVLTFVGSGVISVYGLPKDCLVAAYQDLGRLLVAGGARITARTAEKLSEVARHPRTWLPESLPYQAEQYRWYRSGESAA